MEGGTDGARRVFRAVARVYKTLYLGIHVVFCLSRPTRFMTTRANPDVSDEPWMIMMGGHLFTDGYTWPACWGRRVRG